MNCVPLLTPCGSRILLSAIIILLVGCNTEKTDVDTLAATGMAPIVEAEQVLESTQPDESRVSNPAEIDSATTLTVFSETPTSGNPVIEVVEYTDLAYAVGEEIIVKTNMNSTRRGILKRYLNTSLKVMVNERGREFILHIPRSTVTETQVVWTDAPPVDINDSEVGSSP